jgi:hypothetical protein
MLKRAVLTLLALLAVSVVIVAAISFSGACVSEAGQQDADAYKRSQEPHSRYQRVFTTFGCGVRTLGGAVVDHSNEISAAVTAIATIFIALYTFALSDSTRALRDAAEQQKSDMLESLRIAGEAANAARDGVKVARDEFNATHRPKLRVRLVRLDRINSEGIKANYFIVNVGETAATITWHEITLYAVPNNDMTKAIMQGCLADCPKLAGGESKIILIDVRFEPKQQEFDFHFNVADSGIIRIRGRVEYDDGAGIKRRTGFLRTYDAMSGYFRADESEEEYED